MKIANTTCPRCGEQFRPISNRGRGRPRKQTDDRPEQQRRAIDVILRLIARGRSRPRVARVLNRLHFPTLNGVGIWTDQRVQSVLRTLRRPEHTSAPKNP